MQQYEMFATQPAESLVFLLDKMKEEIGTMLMSGSIDSRSPTKQKIVGETDRTCFSSEFSSTKIFQVTK